ncbi:MAG: hypothetical protein HW405_579 [Candidatus Berkelbacteria bacterium]|nr:hypothetical protein [Candidatus Berkelbacteria bacterium]
MLPFEECKSRNGGDLRIFRGYKKILLWTLIFIIAFSNLLMIFGNPQKAKAVGWKTPDPANPGFYLEYPPPGSTPAAITPASGVNYNQHKSPLEVSWTTTVDTDAVGLKLPEGFIVKTGEAKTTDCSFAGWDRETTKTGTRTKREMSGKCGSVDVKIIIYTDDQTRNIQITDYRIIDNNINTFGLPDGTKLSVQIYGEGSYSAIKTISVAVDTTNPIDLGEAFKDDNIDGYIALKLKPYASVTGDTSEQPPGTSGEVNQEDKDFFKTFMTGFKGDGWQRRVLERITKNPNEDPFRIFGYNTEDSPPNWVSVLPPEEINGLYQTFFKGFTGDTEPDRNNFKAKLKEARDLLDKGLVDEKGCLEIDTELKNNANWADFYKTMSTYVGGAVGFYFSGGLVGTGVGGATGHFVGNGIKSVLNKGNAETAEEKLALATFYYMKGTYALYYLGIRDAQYGLEQYQTKKDNLEEWRGFNVWKARVIKDTVKIYSDKMQECIKSINETIAQITGDDTCGLPITQIGTMRYWLARSLCGILAMLGEVGEWLINALFLSVYSAYHPPDSNKLTFLTKPFMINQAHAASGTLSPLTDALSAGTSQWPWVIESWKWCIGLMDLFLVVILMFIGIVNILHLQYDTYNVKKALPLIIIGVILANFSLLIVRMLLDASNILTRSFMDQDPGTLVKDLITAANVATNKTNGAIEWSSVGGLLIAVLFSIFAIAAFLILGFMFYARYASIILLAVVAPLAFIAMAFPPTQSIFKQWWSWTTKMVFMKPIAMFLLFFAWKVKSSSAAIGDLTAWMIIIFLVYMAILIPWKLGGAISSFWGGVGGTVFGTKKGGWARKPVDEWWQRRKDKTGALVKKSLPGLFAGSERDRQITESMKKTADSRLKKKAWENAGVVASAGEAQTAENKLNNQMKQQQEAYERGELEMNWWVRFMLGGVKWEGGRPKIKTGQDLAQDSAYTAAELVLRTKNYESGQKDRQSVAMAEIARENNDLSDTLAELKNRGQGTQDFEIDEHGRVKWKYQVDEEGNQLEIDGAPAPEVGDVRNMWETVSQLRARALISARNNPELARNLTQSADELQGRVDQFITENPTVDGRRVNYGAFMDKQYAGRVLSGVTPWVMEDVQTNLLNGNPNERYKRSLEGYGNRNVRGTGAELDLFVSGQRSKLGSMSSLAAGGMIIEWVQAMERGGRKNRLLDFANFLRRFDSGGLLGDEGTLLESLVSREERLTPGITYGFLAEQLINARRRGSDVEGLEGIEPGASAPADKERLSKALQAHFAGQVGIDYASLDSMSEEQRAQALAQISSQAVGFIKQNRDMFTRIDVTSRGTSTADTIKLFDGLTDSISEMKIFCGGGNPVQQMVQTKDIPAEKRFAELIEEDPKDTNERRIKKQQNREESERRARSFTSSTPEDFSSSVERAGSARQYEQQNTDVIESIAQQRNALASQITVGGAPLSDMQIRAMAQAIGGVVAANMGELQTGLQSALSLPGLTVSADLDLETPEAINDFKTQVVQLQTNLDKIGELRGQVAAEEVAPYVRVGDRESDESLQASVAKLEEAARSFEDASANLSRAGRSVSDMPKEVMDKAIQALGERQQITPLSKKALESNPMDMVQVLAKMLTGLKAAQRLDASERGNQDALLRAIKQEMRNLNNRLAGDTPPPAGGATPGGTEPAPSQTGPPPASQPPVTPPGNQGAPPIP